MKSDLKISIETLEMYADKYSEEVDDLNLKLENLKEPEKVESPANP
jgi:hypothetical protein